ncbi:MAG: hypothetical protein OES46_13930 [Gammaproteobacteria bacterium]|nr:hypothetical protein [Gammaproteobacteria bacterium]
MNYLTALLAFSAIMIVLATLATVVVEGIHKLARKRASDFEEMLSKLYEDAIAPRLKEITKTELLPDGRLTAATKFARQVTRNPAFREANSGMLRRIPFVKNLFTTTLEELTTRQFVEQLAQTDAGKKLREKGGNLVEKTLGELAYEFERYGEAATSYFERRAAALSVLVAFVLALVLNVDAIKLYGALATDKALAEEVIKDLDIAKLEKVYVDSIETAGGDEQKRAKIAEEYQEVLARIRKDSARLERLGIPIGHSYFPFCSGGPGTTQSNPSDEDFTDPRCKGIKVTRVDEVTYLVVGPLFTWTKRFFKALWTRVLDTQDGIGWLLSVLLSGGLIGLGAPFWFRTYRFVASFVPGLKLPDSTLARRTKTSGATAGGRSATQKTGAAGKSSGTQPDVSPAAEGLSNQDLKEAFENSRR